MTPATISAVARDLYQDAPFIVRWFQIGRPYICPFEALLPHVPEGASVLDVGAGAGLFLALLARRQRITSGIGIDTSLTAAAAATRMAARLARSGCSAPLRFERVAADEPWPEGPFTAVSLIDVMHHVPPSQQQQVFRHAASRLAPGGVLIYKDIAVRPRWRAWANRLHDLVVAREWVHLVPVSQAEEWAAAENLNLKYGAYLPRLWYGHELRVWSRGGPRPLAGSQSSSQRADNERPRDRQPAAGDT